MKTIIILSLFLVLLNCNDQAADLGDESLLNDQFLGLRGGGLGGLLGGGLGGLLGGGGDSQTSGGSGGQYSIEKLLDAVNSGNLASIDTSRVNIRNLISDLKNIGIGRKLALLPKALQALKKIKNSGVDISQVFQDAGKYGIQDFSKLNSINNLDFQYLIGALERARADEERGGGRGETFNLQAHSPVRLLAPWQLWLVLVIIIIIFAIILL